MGRKPRNWNQAEYYHVYNRGIRKEGLFRHPKDYEYFLGLIERTFNKHPVTITSYCLMKTHYHIQIQSHSGPLSDFMKNLTRMYALYYNRTYKLRGPVFEGRFNAKPISDPRGMLHVSRYIHFNPVVSRLTKKPENYQWSSYTFYYHLNSPPPPPYLQLTPILNFFHGTETQRKQKYVEWCFY
ncbi:transposase [Evansella sp. LMS18]|uniref:transposase n=1 Tax=Evansella sp. LMS18 TaxID=2924033 RepID=UPI0034E94BE5